MAATVADTAVWAAEVTAATAGEAARAMKSGRKCALFTPAKAITLSMTGAEVDLVDDRDRKRAFMTDGRKLQKSKDDNYQEIAAKFDGTRLVSDEKDPRGNKMSRTFELSSDGRQLYETLHMTTGRSSAPLVIRYAYDIPIPAQTRQ